MVDIARCVKSLNDDFDELYHKITRHLLVKNLDAVSKDLASSKIYVKPEAYVSLMQYFNKKQVNNKEEVQLSVNTSSLYFTPLNELRSFPYNHSVLELLKPNSINKESIEDEEYATLSEKINEELAKRPFIDEITQEKIIHIMKALLPKHSQLHRLPQLLSILYDIPLYRCIEIYFDVTKQMKGAKSPIDNRWSIMNNIVYFCKICKIYYCDHHFTIDYIKNAQLPTVSFAADEINYFIRHCKSHNYDAEAILRLGVTPQPKIKTGIESQHQTNITQILHIFKQLGMFNYDLLSLILDIDAPCLQQIANNNQHILAQDFDVNVYSRAYHIAKPKAVPKVGTEAYKKNATFNEVNLQKIENIYTKIYSEFCKCKKNCVINRANNSKKSNCLCCNRSKLTRSRVQAECMQVQLQL